MTKKMLSAAETVRGLATVLSVGLCLWLLVTERGRILPQTILLVLFLIFQLFGVLKILAYTVSGRRTRSLEESYGRMCSQFQSARKAAALTGVMLALAVAFKLGLPFLLNHL